MSLVKRLLGEPVLHFVLAGFLLYALAAFLRGPDLMPQDEQEILVSRDDLLTFMQFRANAFDAETFAERFDSFSEEEKNQLIEDYVTEEVLYREAVNLGLEESDYIIRQRMVDKMRFLLMDLSVGANAPTDEELNEYFLANLPAYRIEPSATFAHVFIDASRLGEQQAEKQALEIMGQLNMQAAGFNDAAGQGDRFPFLRNYVERTLKYVSSHFGAGFVAELQNMSAASKWQGPVKSEYGYHLLYLTQLTPARDPAFSEVRAQVERDFLEERAEQQLQEMIESVRAQYRIQTGLQL